MTDESPNETPKAPNERLKSPRLRLFVALDLPEGFLDRLVDWQQQAFGERRDLRLLDRYSLHVTLAFLGYQAERDVERIRELAFSEPGGPFQLRTTDLAEVPPRRPRLYALDVEDEGGKLGQWQAGLSERLQGGGFYEPEKRPFWPHVTVARVRSEGRGSRRPAIVANPPGKLPAGLSEAQICRRMTLYRSELQPTGARYVPLAQVQLPG